METKQLQKLHTAVSKHIANSRASGGDPEAHRTHEVIDLHSPARLDFQREIRQLRVALIADGKKPTFASRLARQVDALIVCELHVAAFEGKPHPPRQEIEDRIHMRTAAREKLNHLFECLSAGALPPTRPKAPRP